MVRIAGAGDVDAIEAALSGSGDGRSCRCQWWTLTAAGWAGETAGVREVARTHPHRAIVTLTLR